MIAALLSLLLATFGVYHGLAIPLAIGIALMVLAAVTLVPAVLATLRPGAVLAGPAEAGQRTSGAWGRLAGRVASRPVAALLIGVIGLAALAGFSLADRAVRSSAAGSRLRRAVTRRRARRCWSSTSRWRAATRSTWC